MSSLTATYTSPTTSSAQAFTHPLPALSPAPSTSSRTAHLAALQSATKALQTDINAFLTQKMEEDKAVSGEDAKDADARAEENYGEEGEDVD